MKKSIKFYFLFFTFYFLLFTFSKAQNPKYEFRGAWVATVDNIDWPSRKGLPVDSQKMEINILLDKFESIGLNAVVMQIRPAADAFYPSQLEPWSEWLTGVQGQAPNPYYDPLKYAIDEAHKRGMEFHAWVNPYRAVFDVYKSSIASNHVTKLHPGWFLTYGGNGNKYKKYFDPGNPDARKWVVNVITDIVKRYDIDAVHCDDYFYPYRIPGKEFPDNFSYLKYGLGKNKDDWRRSNCDTIIYQLSKAIKATKPNVKFGISPFGVWRNLSQDSVMGSNTHAGQTNYDDLYADILLWLRMGWIDYVAPQLYWEIGFEKADYAVLVDWWAQHSYGKQVYIGHGLYKAGTNAAFRNKKELPNQIRMLRDKDEIQGSIFYSEKAFFKNPNGWNDSLRLNFYSNPSLIPPMKWIDSIPPPSPIYSIKKTGIVIAKTKNCEPLKGFMMYAFPKGNINPAFAKNMLHFYPSTDGKLELENFEELKKKYADKTLGITALDLNNNESDILILK